MSPQVDANNAMHSALNALALRQKLITNNIANVDTPGFHASDVKFEDALQRAAGSSRNGLALDATQPGHLQVDGQSAGGVQPEVVTNNDTTLRTDGNNVDIEQQMLRLSETVINYQALSRLASGRLALLRSAVSDGRR